MIWLLKLGFLPIRIWDILDILIVGYLIYQVYKLLRGSIAFNIFVGALMLFIIWWLVGALKMDLLSLLLNQFVSVGVIIILIVFQPEVRRFLLLLGNTTLRQRSKFLRRILDRNLRQDSAKKEYFINEILTAMEKMGNQRWGALIVLAPNPEMMEAINNTGVALEANITQQLIESIFNKEGPLHDGAVTIAGNKIQAASCILPLSDNQLIPQSAGLRHRAAVGLTERMDVATFIVSEETGQMSFAYEGKLRQNLSVQEIKTLLLRHFK
ncbi:MAG: TIGR00159 family protein [Lewinellaceae bacterium]|nr:TIGR00159 family protein [Lewinellaceae bacterium]